MSTRVVFAAIAAVVLAACASVSKPTPGPPPPVKVVVTAAPSLHNVINAGKVAAQMELALRRYAPAASPSTVTIRFTGATLMDTAELRRAEMNGSVATYNRSEPVTYNPAVNTQTVATPSRTTPWLDGFLPPGSSQSPAWASGRQLVVQGTYSIVDANGVTLAEDAIVAGPGAAKEIAARVAKLAR